MDNDIPQLQKSQDKWITDLVSGVLLRLPPLWEVKHKINLVDPDKHIWYQLLKSPEHLHNS